MANLKKKIIDIPVNPLELPPIVSQDLSKLVELEVYGLVVGPYQGRPLLLMKDKSGGAILPVGLSELEAQILAFGSDRQDGPHGVSFAHFKQLGTRVEKTVFQEIKGNRQVLHIHFSGVNGDQPKTVECMAESSMSFCLGSKAPIFASLAFIDQCRRMPLDLQIPQGQEFQRDKIPPHLVQ